MNLVLFTLVISLLVGLYWAADVPSIISPTFSETESKAYKHWKTVSSGKETLDLVKNKRNFLIETFGSDLRGTIKEFPFKGKIGVFKLLDYEANEDYRVTKTYWHLIQFKGEKPIKECTFEEFYDIYYSVLKPKQNEKDV